MFWPSPDLEQAKMAVLNSLTSATRELRDHAMVAMLIGCGLRRAELLVLRLGSIQQREEHWVIADLVGKAAHVRTVPIPDVGEGCCGWESNLMPLDPDHRQRGCFNPPLATDRGQCFSHRMRRLRRRRMDRRGILAMAHRGVTHVRGKDCVHPDIGLVSSG